MSLVNSKIILEKAKKEAYAVGAYNFTNFEGLKAIIEASKETNSDCILSTSESAVNFMGIKNIVSVVKNETENLSQNFALHLDHGKSFEICKECIDNGYTSVMIDASHLPFEENIKLTKKVCEYAKKFNVSVEAELGTLKGIEDNVNSLDSHFTRPEDAKIFVEKTKVDSLAISIGTSHGAYKFKGESKLDINRLIEINKTTNNFPLVLHGASSVSEKLLSDFKNSGGNLVSAKGVDKNSIKEAIKNGICKINVDTDLRIAFTTGVKNCLKDEKVFNLRDYLLCGIENMKNQVVEHNNLFKK